MDVLQSEPSFPRVAAVVVLLCGVPASGKSTLAQALLSSCDLLQQRLQHGELCVSVLEVDQVERAVRMNVAEFDKQAYADARKASREALESRVHQSVCLNDMSKDSVCARVPWQDTRRARVDQGLHACHVLVLDDTHLLAEQRKKVWRIAVRHGAAFLQVFVDSSAMELRQLVARSVDAAQQSHGRKVLVPSDVIQKTIQLAEPPDPSLRAWESDSVTILAADTTSCDRVIEMIIDRVRSSFQQQQQQQQQSQVTIQQGGTPACASRTAHPERDSEAPTVRHAVDLTMRRIISNLIAEASCAAERAVLAGILAERKQRMLSELRSGEINVDDLSEMRIRAYLESARTPAEQAPLYRN